MIEQATEFGKGIGVQVNPILDKISMPLANILSIAPENIHMLLLLTISVIIAGFFAGRERFSIKFWVIAFGGFLLLRFLNF